MGKTLRSPFRRDKLPASLRREKIKEERHINKQQLREVDEVDYIKIGKEIDDDFDIHMDEEKYHMEWDDLIVSYLVDKGEKELASMYVEAQKRFWYT
jgi:hypothetical protein